MRYIHVTPCHSSQITLDQLSTSIWNPHWRLNSIQLDQSIPFLSMILLGLLLAITTIPMVQGETSFQTLFESTMPEEGRVRMQLIFDVPSVSEEWKSNDPTSPLLPQFPAEVKDQLVLVMRDVQNGLGLADDLRPITDVVYTNQPFFSDPQTTGDGTRVVLFAEIADLAELEFEAQRIYVGMRKQRSDDRSVFRHIYSSDVLVSFTQLCNSTGTPSWETHCGVDPTPPIKGADFLYSVYCGLCCMIAETLILGIVFHKSRLLTADPVKVKEMADWQARKQRIAEKERLAKDQAMGLAPMMPLVAQPNQVGDYPGSGPGGPPGARGPGGALFLELGDRSGYDDALNMETENSFTRQGTHTAWGIGGGGPRPATVTAPLGGGGGPSGGHFEMSESRVSISEFSVQRERSINLGSPSAQGAFSPMSHLASPSHLMVGAPRSPGNFSEMPLTPSLYPQAHPAAAFAQKHAIVPVYPPGAKQVMHGHLASVNEAGETPKTPARTMHGQPSPSSGMVTPASRPQPQPAGMVLSPAARFAANAHAVPKSPQAAPPATAGQSRPPPTATQMRPTQPPQPSLQQQHQVVQNLQQQIAMQQQRAQPPQQPMRGQPIAAHVPSQFHPAPISGTPVGPTRVVGVPRPVQMMAPPPVSHGGEVEDLEAETLPDDVPILTTHLQFQPKPAILAGHLPTYTEALAAQQKQRGTNAAPPMASPKSSVERGNGDSEDEEDPLGD